MQLENESGEKQNGPVVSVIIPFLDALDEIPSLLEAIREQTLSTGSYEVIFVDNGSSDGSLEWLSAHGPPGSRVLRCPDRHRPYAARNRGIEAARADIVAFTDADCRPDPAWLEAGLKALERAPRAAGRIDLVCSDHPSLAELVDSGRFLRQWRYAREGFGATANLFVRREVFDGVGGFDELLVSGGDYEFGQRASAAGFPILYDADTIVRHPARATFHGLSRKAYRVGYGFGQSLGLGQVTPRSAAGRIIDRVRLCGGRGLGERGRIVRGLPTRVGIVLGLILLHLVTFLAILAGYSSVAMRGWHPHRKTTGPILRKVGLALAVPHQDCAASRGRSRPSRQQG